MQGSAHNPCRPSTRRSTGGNPGGDTMLPQHSMLGLAVLPLNRASALDSRSIPTAKRGPPLPSPIEPQPHPEYPTPTPQTPYSSHVVPPNHVQPQHQLLHAALQDTAGTAWQVAQQAQHAPRQRARRRGRGARGPPPRAVCGAWMHTRARGLSAQGGDLPTMQRRQAERGAGRAGQGAEEQRTHQAQLRQGPGSIGADPARH